MSNRWRPARETEPPKTFDLSRYLDLSSPEPLTLNLNDRSYRLPPHTRYVRYGLSQEGLSVEYQDADGDWHGAHEIATQPAEEAADAPSDR